MGTRKHYGNYRNRQLCAGLYADLTAIGLVYNKNVNSYDKLHALWVNIPFEF